MTIGSVAGAVSAGGVAGVSPVAAPAAGVAGPSPLTAGVPSPDAGVGLVCASGVAGGELLVSLPAEFAAGCGRSPNAGRVVLTPGSSELELEQAMPTNESNETTEQKL